MSTGTFASGARARLRARDHRRGRRRAHHHSAASAAGERLAPGHLRQELPRHVRHPPGLRVAEGLGAPTGTSGRPARPPRRAALVRPSGRVPRPWSAASITTWVPPPEICVGRAKRPRSRRLRYSANPRRYQNRCGRCGPALRRRRSGVRRAGRGRGRRRPAPTGRRSPCARRPTRPRGRCRPRAAGRSRGLAQHPDDASEGVVGEAVGDAKAERVAAVERVGGVGAVDDGGGGSSPARRRGRAEKDDGDESRRCVARATAAPGERRSSDPPACEPGPSTSPAAGGTGFWIGRIRRRRARSEPARRAARGLRSR